MNFETSADRFLENNSDLLLDLARFPVGWAHPSDKNSFFFKEAEQGLDHKSLQLVWNMRNSAGRLIGLDEAESHRCHLKE